MEEYTIINKGRYGVRGEYGTPPHYLAFIGFPKEFKVIGLTLQQAEELAEHMSDQPGQEYEYFVKESEAGA